MKILSNESKGPASFLLLLLLCFPRMAAPAGQEQRKLFCSLEGVVIDSRTNQAVAEARVRLERGGVPSSLRSGSEEKPVSVVTDERGRVRFDSIEHGVYTLVVTKRGYVPSPFHALELKPGTTTTRKVELDPLAKVSGRVVDEADHAVAGARLAAMVSLMRPSA